MYKYPSGQDTSNKKIHVVHPQWPESRRPWLPCLLASPSHSVPYSAISTVPQSSPASDDLVVVVFWPTLEPRLGATGGTFTARAVIYEGAALCKLLKLVRRTECILQAIWGGWYSQPAARFLSCFQTCPVKAARDLVGCWLLAARESGQACWGRPPFLPYSCTLLPCKYDLK